MTEQDDKLVFKHILVEILNIKHGMEDNLIIMKKLYQDPPSEVYAKKLVITNARQHIVSMNRVYKLGKTWLINSLLDLSLLISTPTPAVLVTQEPEILDLETSTPEPEDIKIDVEDFLDLGLDEISRVGQGKIIIGLFINYKKFYF